MDFSRSCDKCKASPPYDSSIRDEGRRFKHESREEARLRVAKLKYDEKASEEADGDKTPKNDKKTRRWYLEQEWEASRGHYQQRLEKFEEDKERKNERGNDEDEAEAGSITPRAQTPMRKSSFDHGIKQISRHEEYSRR